MKRCSFTIALALVVARAFAADASLPAADDACRKNLQQLAAAISSYQLLNEKLPAKLSDLFSDGLVDDLRLFVCPSSPTKAILAIEIDAKSDYVLGEPGKDIVRERAAFHANGERLAIVSDGTIVALDASGAPKKLPVTTTTSPATPPPPTNPLTPATPDTAKPRKLTARELLAAERGDTAEVRSLIAGNDPNARDEFVQRSALAWAIFLDDRAAFTRLLATPGADVNALDGRNETPLLIAVGYAAGGDMAAVVEALIAKGARVTGENMGVTPLMLAANGNAPDIVRAILKKLPASAIDARTGDGTTALIMSASVGALEVVQLLLEKGAAVDGADKRGTTPLIHAAGRVFPLTVPTVKLLLDKGANPNARDNDGNTPLSAATARGSAEVVALLRKAGAK